MPVTPLRTTPPIDTGDLSVFAGIRISHRQILASDVQYRQGFQTAATKYVFKTSILHKWSKISGKIEEDGREIWATKTSNLCEPCAIEVKLLECGQSIRVFNASSLSKSDEMSARFSEADQQM
jgi:hypothetical protein